MQKACSTHDIGKIWRGTEGRVRQGFCVEQGFRAVEQGYWVEQRFQRCIKRIYKRAALAAEEWGGH